MTDTSTDVIETSRDGNVGIIRLVDERRRNALSAAMREGFVNAFYAMMGDPDVRAIYITGRGQAFCAGGDLRMMRDGSDPWSSHQRLSYTGRWLTDFLRCPKPVVVGVNGVAVGGGIGIAVIGDVIVAAENAARFQAGFMRLGLLPDIGVMYTLPRLVGLARAKAFLFENGSWTARQAEAAGLVTAVVPDEELEARCLERAAALAAGPVEAYGLAKRIMGASYETSLDNMMLHEDLGQSLAYSTEAMREGLSALTEKRPADFVTASEREPAVKNLRDRDT
jgi:2-(1,2-epoxy-1,2-dihydrophenyl)acetyl-CoA isomerase